MKYFVILNPTAGNGSTRNIVSLLQNNLPSCSSACTQNAREAFTSCLRLLTKKITPQNVKIFKARCLRVCGDASVLAHADAEVIGKVPADINVVPCALRVIC